MRRLAYWTENASESFATLSIMATKKRVEVTDPADVWQPSRLIPITGIGGTDEQERRATSALLAVVSAVDEFGKEMLSTAKAPAGRIDTFIECRFKHGDGYVIPDGLIRVSRGKRTWTALVEVKTADNPLKRDQVESYLDVAKDQGFDAVITISNELQPMAGQHPTEVEKRKLRKVNLIHLSWTRILTMAIVEKTHRGIKDPDQAWILGELIRYLESSKAGAMPTVDLGKSWVAVRDSAKRGTLRANDKGVKDVAARWDQLLRYGGLVLGRDLGSAVDLVVPPAQRDNPAARVDALVAGLVATGRLEGTLKIPDVAAPINIYADLRTRRVGATMEISAPKEGRARTRVNWLLRQLKDKAPDALVIDAYPARSRDSMSEPLGAAVTDPDLLLDSGKREPARFVLSLTAPMGTKRALVSGGFPSSVLDNLNEFYGTTAQSIKPWTPSAPKLKRPEPEQPAPAAASALVVRDGS